MVVTYHDTENRPKGGICVANHTTPIDIMTLACDNAYALTGQRHGGFNGYFQVLLLNKANFDSSYTQPLYKSIY